SFNNLSLCQGPALNVSSIVKAYRKVGDGLNKLSRQGLKIEATPKHPVKNAKPSFSIAQKIKNDIV
ncbi:MAG TPA: hypothetical protein DCZ48_05485, partial [Methylococcaceae bacterium]|nr:hypothetical protein [Methylococcaceae bacterium]